MVSIFFEPLEQFEVKVVSVLLLPFGSNLYLVLTNFLLYTLIVILSFLFFYFLGFLSPMFIPTKSQLIIEQYYLFILDIIKQQIGFKGLKYFPFLFTLFSFIVFANFVGMSPFGFTVTSHLLQTLTLGLSAFYTIIFLSLIIQKAGFINTFLPSGVPTILIPLIFIIEIVSYASRSFSLALRLFANMMSGHTLLNILLGFSLKMAQSTLLIIKFVSLIPFLIVCVIIALELGIAFLQAYVFTVLVSIYLNDSFGVEH